VKKKKILVAVLYKVKLLYREYFFELQVAGLRGRFKITVADVSTDNPASEEGHG
jgi:hypothetical protein